MADANKLLSERLQRIETIPNKFINAVNASQAELYAELMTILSQLGMKNGFLELTPENLLLIDELMNEYYLSLRNGRYGAKVSWFANEMRKQQALIEAWTFESFAATVSMQTKTVYTSATQQALRSLLGDDFKTNFINVIRDQIVSGVEQQASFTDFKNGLLDMFQSDQRDPQIVNWVKQVASDRFASADRNYSWAVSQDLGLQFVQYVGGIIEDSREFCIERDKKYFHVKEVLDWADIEQWQGRYRNTSRENIQTWLGGYRCQHSIVPVSESVVPKEVIERAKALGYYEN